MTRTDPANSPANGPVFGRADRRADRPGSGPAPDAALDPAGGLAADLAAGLAADLSGLAADAPPGLLDRIAARRVRVPGPLPDLHVAFTDRGVAFLRAGLDAEAFTAAFRERFARPLLPADRPPAGLLPALRAGRPAGVPLDLRGLTEFEAAVLRAAAAIPRGQIRPYAWVAREAGHPRAVRAVGTALGRNPVPLLIPCHRVTRSDGSAGQYVFGDDAKLRLLRGEDVDVDAVADLARRGTRLIGSGTTGIVCYPTCGDARRITPAHRRGFANLAAARAAGYRPCARCRPA